jgi:mannose-1-phosphate guanylyltransferase / phosphomannomutase
MNPTRPAKIITSRSETRQPIRAMVMAAGAGTRLRPLTSSVPKPMVPIANRPVLEYTVENLRRHGITEIMFNLHSHPQMIQDYFKDGSKWGVSIEYSHEPQLLGTAGGVKKVESFLKGGTFLVMSGDGLTDVNLSDMLSFHIQRDSMATMGLKPVDTRFDYGVTITRSNGRITRFIEKPKWSDVFSNQVNTGVYVFEPEVLSLIPRNRVYDFGHDVWPQLLAKKKPIFGYPISQYWCDVGNLGEYRRAQHDALEGIVGIQLPGQQIRPGVWVDQGAVLERDVQLEGPCLIGRDCHIGKGATIGAYTVMGRGCRIGAGAVLHNSILWDHVRVGPEVKLENCIFGHNARVTENISVFEGAVINISQ